MASISLTIPNEYVTRLLTAINGLYPQPQVRNPAYDAFFEGLNPSDEPYNPSAVPPEYYYQYTDVQWAKQKLREFLIGVVRNYEERVAVSQAKASVSVPEDMVE